MTDDIVAHFKSFEPFECGRNNTIVRSFDQFGASGHNDLGGVAFRVPIRDNALNCFIFSCPAFSFNDIRRFNQRAIDEIFQDRKDILKTAWQGATNSELRLDDVEHERVFKTFSLAISHIGQEPRNK